MLGDKKLLVGLGVLAAFVGVGLAVSFSPDDSSVDQAPTKVEMSDAAPEPEPVTPPPPAEEADFSTTRQFTPEDFKLSYDDLSLANIAQIIFPPDITGDSQVDSHIRSLAEARGYQLRHVATNTPASQIDGQNVQFLLVEDWQALSQDALDDGVVMSVISGYRPVEEQRQLFLGRLREAGATDEAIRQGSADDVIDSVLKVTAPPGYSRHHSGYTIDLEDAHSPIFGSSASYAWLSKDNFENAKQHGFIPSYPEGLENQGPDPEEWELVWVGKPITFEQ